MQEHAVGKRGRELLACLLACASELTDACARARVRASASACARVRACASARERLDGVVGDEVVLDDEVLH
eukprot:2401407-Pleurochrysis_carterae.AAC.1